MTPFVRRLIDEGIRHSPTFAAEVRALSSSDIIVLVEPAQGLPSGICGHTTFLSARAGFRYLQVVFETRYNVPQTIGIIGHELRHALEVAVHPEVVDEATFGAMYEQIGYRSRLSRRTRAYDSAEAIEAGRAIVQEMVSSPLDADEAEAGR